jgi:predicted O-methyltransferase YrrM
MDALPNWFENDGLQNFEDVLLQYKDVSVRMLQIGAYTGDASVWILHKVLSHENSILVDVDTWEGSDEPSHHEMQWNAVEAQYDHKTQHGRSNRKILKFKGTSDWFFKNNLEQYDFIYIDGDHTAYGVLKDAVAAFECLKVGGILAFDDYQWSAGLGTLNEPKLAIDAFSLVYSDRLATLVDGYQRWYQKIR